LVVEHRRLPALGVPEVFGVELRRDDDEIGMRLRHALDPGGVLLLGPSVEIEDAVARVALVRLDVPGAADHGKEARDDEGLSETRVRWRRGIERGADTRR